MIEPKPIDLSSLRTIFPPTTAPTSRDARASRLVTKQERHTFRTITGTRKAVAQIGALPEPGETLHLLLEANAFAVFEIMPALIELVGKPATAVRLATLGINDRHVDAIDRMALGGLVSDVGMVVSHYFSKADPEEFAHACKVFDRHGFKVAAARSHAKVIALQFGDQHYVATGSGNLRSCRASESLVVFADAAVYAWHAKWIDQLLEAA